MSKQDLGSKLKARLGEWEAYGDLPIPPLERVSEQDRSRAEEQALPESVALVALEERPSTSQAPGEFAPAEAQIADLQSALEHERDQSRRLLDVVEREQVLHAVTLRSQVQRPAVPITLSHQRDWKFERPDKIYNEYPRSSAKTNVILIFMALCIAVGCTFLVYTLVH